MALPRRANSRACSLLTPIAPETCPTAFGAPGCCCVCPFYRFILNELPQHQMDISYWKSSSFAPSCPNDPSHAQHTQHFGHHVRSNLPQTHHFCISFIAIYLTILCCSLALVFAFSVIIVSVVFVLNLRRSRRQVSTHHELLVCPFVFTRFGLQDESLSAFLRPESSYITACVWLFMPAAVTRCVLLIISAQSSRCVSCRPHSIV